jgi:hypothetical protein
MISRQPPLAHLNIRIYWLIVFCHKSQKHKVVPSKFLGDFVPSWQNVFFLVNEIFSSVDLLKYSNEKPNPIFISDFFLRFNFSG